MDINLSDNVNRHELGLSSWERRPVADRVIRVLTTRKMFPFEIVAFDKVHWFQKLFFKFLLSYPNVESSVSSKHYSPYLLGSSL